MAEQDDIRKWLIGHLAFAAGLAAVTVARRPTPQERARREEKRREAAQAAERDAAARGDWRRQMQEQWEAMHRRRAALQEMWSRPETRALWWNQVYERFAPEEPGEAFRLDEIRASGSGLWQLSSDRRGDRLVHTIADWREGLYEYRLHRADGSSVSVRVSSTRGQEVEEFASYIVSSLGSPEDLVRIATFLSAPRVNPTGEPVVLARPRPLYETGSRRPSDEFLGALVDREAEAAAR